MQYSPTPPEKIDTELKNMGFDFVKSWDVGLSRIHIYVSIKLGQIEYNEKVGQMVFHKKEPRPVWSVNFVRKSTGCWDCAKTIQSTYTSPKDQTHDELLEWVAGKLSNK